MATSATSIAAIREQVRQFLRETTARFWSDDELTTIMKNGAVDLWGAILDLHADHYLTRSTQPVLRSGQDQISGIPEDCFRIIGIEPQTLTSGADGRLLRFVPRKYTHPDFEYARTLTSIDVNAASSIFYAVTGVGWPVEPMSILTAPLVNADLRLRIIYNPGVPWDGVNNPIPGGSDNALKAWTISYALGKERENQLPDPGWLAIYATEKQSILTRLTPRQEQEPEVVEDMFQGYQS